MDLLLYTEVIVKLVYWIGPSNARKHGYPRVVFGQRKLIILGKQHFFYCLSAGASKPYFEYNAKKVVLCLSKSWQMAPWFEIGCPKQVVFT